MSTSLLDYLQPSEDPGGLSGLALALQGQGGQPQGIRQGLGAGLLNVSNLAQESLPNAIQGGFGPGLLAGFLGSVGAPARQAVSQEEEKSKQRRQLQMAFLQEAFPKLTSASKQVVLQKLGVDLGGLQFQESAAEPSLAMKELTRKAVDIMGDPKRSVEERKAAFASVQQLDPTIGEAFSGLQFIAPGPDTMEDSASRIASDNTPESVNRFFDSRSPDYMRYDRLVPIKDKDKATTLANQQKLQGVSDYGEIVKLAQQRGITIDDATDIFFAGDTARRANYEDTFHISAGSTPKSYQDRILESAKILAQQGILKTSADVVPAAVKLLEDTEAAAKKMAQAHGGGPAIPTQSAGAKNPAFSAPAATGEPFTPPPAVFGGQLGTPTAAPIPAPAFPGPVAPPQAAPPVLAPQTVPVPPKLTEGQTGKAATQTEALYRAAVASGIDLSGVTNNTTLMAKLKALPIAQRQAILQAAQSMTPKGGLTD